MGRSVLDIQLHEVAIKTARLGTLIETALKQSLQALENYDQTLCGMVLAAEVEIDDLAAEVERQAFQALMLQQPLGSWDLRFLSSSTSIVSDLKRTGDNAVGIVKILIRMPPQSNNLSQVEIKAPSEGDETSEKTVSEVSIMAELLSLGSEASKVLQKTMQAFENRDAQAARTIWKEDDVVDESYQQLRTDLMTIMSGIHAIPALEQDAHIMQRMTYWLWIAHNLERVGDHCTNIAERIVFIAEGDRKSRSKKQRQ
ncbi:MAG TPA: PhoU domain-containing protein [Ktedonobacteraceae bacterium]|nr:PhoU domain-containing protein [Ktedonobacteraceae bacterium]